METLEKFVPSDEKCSACQHPMTAHTEHRNGDGVPFLVCARTIQVGADDDWFVNYAPCGCKLINS